MPSIALIVMCCQLPVAIVAAAQGLLAIWAATGRAHWFLRALTAYCGVMLLIPARAYEPAAIFAFGSLLVAAALLGPRLLRFRPRATDETNGAAIPPNKLRFNLSDLFLVVTFVALLLASWQAINQDYRLRDCVALFMAGALLATNMVCSYKIALGPRRLRAAAALLTVSIATPFAASITAPNSKAVEVWHAVCILENTPFYWFDLVTSAAFHAALSALVALGVVLAWHPVAQPAQWVRLVRRGLAAVAAVCVLFLAWLYWQMLWLTPLPAHFTGRANDYSRLVDIAQALEGNRSKGIPPDANPAPLVAEAVRLVKSPSFVVWDERQLTKAGLDEHQETASRMRNISRHLAADAKAASSAGQADRAAECGIANLLLGTAMNRGGDTSDALVGNSCQIVGLINAAEVRRLLSPTARRSVLVALQRSLSESEEMDTILARTNAYSERAYGWFERYRHVQCQLLQVDVERQITCDMRQRTGTLVQLLQADLAIREFREDQGRWPTDLRELSPGYLSAMPLDLYGGQPLRFRSDGDSFVLYSAGPDGRDDGGNFTNQSKYRQAGFDYDLDTHTRP